MKPKLFLIPATILLLCILIFGFTFTSTSGGKDIVHWSERSLTWEDFKLVNSMEKDYVATIYSYISCPNLITENDSRVYAYMNPNLSERLKNEHDSYNVLIHEQYHFNLTEYCARLLRKDIVELGLGGLSLETMKTLKEKYSKKLDSLQDVYDSKTDHNSEGEIQRYWELQIDDWLRQTASYENEDIYSYYDFTKNRTDFFKTVYFTHTQKVLYAHPVGEQDKDFGEVYQIEYPNHKEQLVKFYKDGKLTNGGYFDTAITKIVQKEKGVFEVQYYDADENYNTQLTACIRKISVDNNKNILEQFFNAAGDRVYRKAVYEIKRDYRPDEKSYYTTYFNKKGVKISNADGIFHEKSTLDEKDRTIQIENFDHKHQPRNDTNYIARYETAFSNDHESLYRRMYDENGQFAKHLSDYHLSYEYDNRGRKVRITSLDANEERTYDHNGASIYEYTYDRHDRQTSVKRYNVEHKPIVANDNYFQKVTDYDAKGRIIFEAEYYPEYVLRFTDKRDGAQKYTYENDTLKKIYNVDAYNTNFENDHKVAVTIQILNSKKEVVKETYLDADENLATTEDGVVRYRYKYDSHGNKIETAAYDALDHLLEFEADVATIRWEYDANGNKLKTSYYNKNNDLAAGTDGITYNLYVYNEKKQLIERKNYDLKMRPAEIDGVFRSRIQYNTAGLDSIIQNYSSDNTLKKGAAITKFYYNKYGYQTKVEYYDAKHKRTKNANGISAINYLYNERQLLMGYEYFDTKNRRVNNQHGVAIERSELDELGHTLSYAYFDKSQKPVIGEYGYHKVAYVWADIGQTSKTITYGPDEQLMEDEDGTAIYEYTLASSGMASIIERYNKDGVLADNINNVSVSHYENQLNGLYYLDKELNALGEVVNDTITE